METSTENSLKHTDIGDIVHYVDADGHHFPAIILGFSGNNDANLLVFNSIDQKTEYLDKVPFTRRQIDVEHWHRTDQEEVDLYSSGKS